MQCGARTRSGAPCKTPVVRGSTRCRMHGGSSPQAREKAKRRLIEADATAMLAHEGLRPLGDPIVELGKLATEVSAMKDALAARVNALPAPTAVDAFGNENVRAEVKLYSEALDRTIKVLDLLGKHDLDARLVRVQEDQGRLFQYLVAGIVSELALTSEQTANLPEVMAKHLRQVAAGVKSSELPPAA